MGGTTRHSNIRGVVFIPRKGGDCSVLFAGRMGDGEVFDLRSVRL
jgi:hypothetical protein